MTNLNEMKSKELKEMAKELGVKNWWTLKKNELIEEIAFAIADKEDQGEEVNVDEIAETAAESSQDDAEAIETESHETNQDAQENATESNVDDPEHAEEKPTPKRGALLAFNGKEQNICAWGKELGISPNTLYGRIYKMGWTIERAFTTPARSK